MTVYVLVRASDLQEVEGKPGVLVNLSFSLNYGMDRMQLEGVVSITDEMEIGSVHVTVDDLGLGNELNIAMLHAAAQPCWKSLFIYGRVATGLDWQSLRPWLRELDEQAVFAVESSIGDRPDCPAMSGKALDNGNYQTIPGRHVCTCKQS